MVDRDDIVVGIRKVTEGEPLAELTSKERVIVPLQRKSAGPGAAFRVAGGQQGAGRRAPGCRVTPSSRCAWGTTPCWWNRRSQEAVKRGTLPERVGPRGTEDPGRTRDRGRIADRDDGRLRAVHAARSLHVPGRFAPIEEALETYGHHYPVIIHLNDMSSSDFRGI